MELAEGAKEGTGDRVLVGFGPAPLSKDGESGSGGIEGRNEVIDIMFWPSIHEVRLLAEC